MSNITLFSGNSVAAVNFTTFSDGSETCTIGAIPECTKEGYVSVSVKVENCNTDLIRIGLVKDALERAYPNTVRAYLQLDYVPQARADRVFGCGMPLPIKVFANIINSYNFNIVFISDPHSDVTPALINNVSVTSQNHKLSETHGLISRYMPEFTLCAPDLGATKKIFDSVQMLEHKTYVQAIKIRDVSTGNIIKCEIIDPDSVKGQSILIVDDIADGGASFKFLAQKLKAHGATKVGLYVTHGIFAKGLKELEDDIDYIFCPNIVCNYINETDILNFNQRA